MAMHSFLFEFSPVSPSVVSFFFTKKLFCGLHCPFRIPLKNEVPPFSIFTQSVSAAFPWGLATLIHRWLRHFPPEFPCLLKASLYTPSGNLCWMYNGTLKSTSLYTCLNLCLKWLFFLFGRSLFNGNTRKQWVLTQPLLYPHVLVFPTPYFISIYNCHILFISTASVLSFLEVTATAWCIQRLYIVGWQIQTRTKSLA